MRIIKVIVYDWFYTSGADEGEGYEKEVLGRPCSQRDVDGKITKIDEHRPAGEGDRWFYDIYVDDKLWKRVFNPSSVEYF